MPLEIRRSRREAVRRDTTLPVRPYVTAELETIPCRIVGYARTRSAAIRPVRDVGWRVIYEGGLIEESEEEGNTWSGP